LGADEDAKIAYEAAIKGREEACAVACPSGKARVSVAVEKAVEEVATEASEAVEDAEEELEEEEEEEEVEEAEEGGDW